MAGEITLRELSPKLREFIENSGGGGSINANIKTCGFTATKGQTTFTVPFENYIPEECYLDVKVNSIWVSPNEYTINGKEVTFKTALDAGTEVFFTVYLVGATAVESVSANVVVENEQKQFVTAQEKSKISEIDNVYKKPISMPNGTDVKSCYETGVYRSYGWVDYPTECYDGQGVLIVTNWGGDTSTGWLSQEFITPHNKNRYIRAYVNGTVGEWHRVALTSETQSKLPAEYYLDYTQMILNYATARLRFTHSNDQAYIQAGTKDGTKGVMNLTGYNGDTLTGLNISALNDNATVNGKQIATTTKAQLSLVNGWTDFFGTAEPATISRVGNVVTIKACIKGGTYTTGTTIFTVPSDCKPSTTQTMLIDVEDSSWVASRKFITVYNDGRCVCNGVHSNIRVTIYVSYII